MKRTTVTLTLTFSLLVSGLAGFVHSSSAVPEAPQLQWSKTYGFIQGDSILQANDGDLAVAASVGKDPVYVGHGSYGFTTRTGALFKIDLDGNVNWEKPLPVEPGTLIKTKDGGFALAGTIERLGAYPHSFFVALAKIDSQGNILWNQTYENMINGTSYQDSGGSVIAILQTEDGGFVLGGYEFILNYTYDYKAWLMKTDSLGNVLWLHYYGVEGDSYGSIQNSVQAIAETDDGFIFAGYLDGALVVKTDYQGTIQWTKTYDHPTEFRSMIKTEDDNFIIAGYRGEYPQTAYVVKLDAAFNTVWNRTYEEYFAFSIKASVEEGYLFTNHIYSGNSLIKTDLDGNIEWIYRLNGSVSSAVQTKDGGYVLTGEITHPDAIDSEITDILVERLASNVRTIPEPFPVVPIAAGVAVVAVVIVAAGLLLQHRKRHREHLANSIFSRAFD